MNVHIWDSTSYLLPKCCQAPEPITNAPLSIILLFLKEFLLSRLINYFLIQIKDNNSHGFDRISLIPNIILDDISENFDQKLYDFFHLTTEEVRSINELFG